MSEEVLVQEDSASNTSVENTEVSKVDVDVENSENEQSIETEKPKEKTFTQEELNKIVAKEKAIERRKIQREQRSQKQFSVDDPEIANILSDHPIENYSSDSEWLLDVSEKIAKVKAEKQTEEQKKEQFQDKILDSGISDYNEVVMSIKDIISPTLVNTAIEYKDGHLMLYELAKNKKEAQRIAKLPEVLQSVEAIKFYESKKTSKKQVSNAPPPITPIDEKGGTILYTNPYHPDAIKNMSSRDWNKLRDEFEKRK